MLRWIGALVITIFAGMAYACSLCPNPQNIATLRQEASQAKMVLYGTMQNPKLGPTGTVAGSTTELLIDSVLKSDPYLEKKKAVEIPRFVAGNDPKAPPKYVIFCDVFNGKLYSDRGVECKTPAPVDYVRGAMALDPKDSTARLLYFFRYLDHADPALAGDAYLEFVKANDREVGLAAPKLSAEKLRKLIADPQTPPNRLGLYAFLLGACGGEEDARFLRGLIEKPTEQSAKALDGVLAGYIHLRPKEGWDVALATLRDPKKPFGERLSVLSMVRFVHGAKGEEARRDVLRGLAALLDQGDIADLAIEDLRNWQLWDLTGDVLAQYGKKSHEAPIMRRAIVRYALVCPRGEAERFVALRRKAEPDLVKDVEEALRLEKLK